MKKIILIILGLIVLQSSAILRAEDGGTGVRNGLKVKSNGSLIIEEIKNEFVNDLNIIEHDEFTSDRKKDFIKLINSKDGLIEKPEEACIRDGEERLVDYTRPPKPFSIILCRQFYRSMTNYVGPYEEVGKTLAKYAIFYEYHHKFGKKEGDDEAAKDFATKCILQIIDKKKMFEMFGSLVNKVGNFDKVLCLMENEKKKILLREALLSALREKRFLDARQLAPLVKYGDECHEDSLMAEVIWSGDLETIKAAYNAGGKFCNEIAKYAVGENFEIYKFFESKGFEKSLKHHYPALFYKGYDIEIYRLFKKELGISLKDSIRGSGNQTGIYVLVRYNNYKLLDSILTNEPDEKSVINKQVFLPGTKERGLKNESGALEVLINNIAADMKYYYEYNYVQEREKEAIKTLEVLLKHGARYRIHEAIELARKHNLHEFEKMLVEADYRMIP